MGGEVLSCEFLMMLIITDVLISEYLDSIRGENTVVIESWKEIFQSI